MRLLLDTATFIWALQSPERLSARATDALREEDAVRELSAVSITEIAIKSGKGKLNVHRQDILAGLADLRVRVLSWNARHALRLFDLPQHHTAPFARQLLAQALAEKIPIVASDEKFRLYKGVDIIW